VASWRAHQDGGVTCLEAADGGGALVSARADKSLALWDLRRCSAGGSGGAPAPLAVFSGHKVRRGAAHAAKAARTGR
jgi:hypothetical protein